MPPTLFPEVIDITSSPEPYIAASRLNRPTPRKERSKRTVTRAGTSKSGASKARTKSTPHAIIDLSKDHEESPFPSSVKPRASLSPKSHLLRDDFGEKAGDVQYWAASEVGDDSIIETSRFPSPEAPAKSEAVKGDDLDSMLASVLEVLPDVLPAHALMLLRQLHPTYAHNTAHAVIQYLFDHEYPKVERDRGKRKREDDDEELEMGPQKKARLGYESLSRPYPSGAAYSVLAEEQLFEDFPLVPRPHVRKVMEQCHYFYAPSHLRLLDESKRDTLPYALKAKPTPARTKGKGKASFDPDFESERAWLMQKLQEDKLKADEAFAEKLNEEEYARNGEGMECGCCFGEYPFDKMVQCAEGHLFCRDCARRQAEERLGLRQTELVCMDQSDCKALFPESEIARFLPEKTLNLYHRIKQGKEIENAGLEGLESCPFCDYACVIENDEEKLFRCENGECLVISCRMCKKPDHLPKSCKEAEEDMRLSARHAVEEAMTNALMRKCPKCHHPFVKEGGCNKMLCQQCRTLSCYICRQVISGYDHFNQQPGQPRNTDTVKDSSKCPLWDTNLDKYHAEEVAAAAKKAQQEILSRTNGGDVQIEEKDLHVELPKAPPTPPGPGPGQPGYNGGPLPAEFLFGIPHVPFGPVAGLGGLPAGQLHVHAHNHRHHWHHHRHHHHQPNFVQEHMQEMVARLPALQPVVPGVGRLPGDVLVAPAMLDPDAFWPAGQADAGVHGVDAPASGRRGGRRR